MIESVPEEVLADARAFTAELERLLATITPVNTLPPAETRQARREGRGAYGAPVFVPEARTLEIEGPAGSIPLRLIAGDRQPTGVFLHFHGGGWTLGENDMQDPRLARFARDTGLTVISVGYRLAPEHPYPAAPDDCEAAALWLISGAQGADIAAGVPLALGGDSAGAHLAVLTLLRLRDRHGITGAFAGAVLEYGSYDLSMTPSQRLWGDRNLVISTPIIQWFREQFVPDYDPERRRDPNVSPLYAELSGMPPAMFTVGTEDPLLDDSLFMAVRWRAAGGSADLRVWPGAPHGFISFPMSVADLALAAEFDFLRHTLALDR